MVAISPGIPLSVTEGTPAEIWCAALHNLYTIPQKKHFLARAGGWLCALTDYRSNM